MFETDPDTGRNRPHGDSAAVPRDDPWPAVAGMCRTWPPGLGGHADPGNMTPRTARALARAPGVTIDDPYDAMPKRIPENGPTVRQAGTSDPARRA